MPKFWLLFIALVALLACKSETFSEYVKRSELIHVLQEADQKLTSKFDQLDATIRRLEARARRERAENE